MATILFEKLKCVRRAPGGPDQTYAMFKVGGQLVGRWPSADDNSYRQMNNDSVEDIGLIYEYSSPLSVELREWDSGADDNLGSQVFVTHLLPGSGEANIRSNSEGTHYQLLYRVLENKTKYVRLIEARCLAVASGIDQAALTEVLNLSGDVTAAAANAVGTSDPAVSAGLNAATSVLRRVPAVAAAIDAARQDPDQLYLTRGNAEGRGNRIWPYGKQHERILNGQSAQFNNLNLPLGPIHRLNIGFWEYDSGSGDDYLGTLTIDPSSPVGRKVQLVTNPVEGALYLVDYEVIEVRDAPPINPPH